MHSTELLENYIDPFWKEARRMVQWYFWNKNLMGTVELLLQTLNILSILSTGYTFTFDLINLMYTVHSTAILLRL